MQIDGMYKRFWRQLCFDVPRLLSNAASRQRVFGILIILLVILLIFSAFYGAIAVFEYKFGGGIYGIALVCISYVLAFGIRKGIQKTGTTIRLGIDVTPPTGLHEGILDQRLMLAVLVNRAAFEAARQSETPPTIELGAVRANMLDRLRVENLWEKLPRQLRDCLAAPEGSWTKEKISRALLHMEAVSVLGWVVDPQVELTPLRAVMNPDPALLRRALAKPDPVRQLSFLRSESEVQAEYGPSHVYIRRLSNELIKRGIETGELDQDLEQYVGEYMTYAVSVGDAEFVAEDLPIGNGLVSEATSEELFRLRGLAAVRLITLEAIKEVLRTKKIDALQQLILNLA
jgi:hypothetical protein